MRMSTLPHSRDDRLDQLVGHAQLGEIAAEHEGVAVDLRRGLLGDVAIEVVDQRLGALRRENSSAVARPMPRAEPVTIATLSWKD